MVYKSTQGGGRGGGVGTGGSKVYMAYSKIF